MVKALDLDVPAEADFVLFDAPPLLPVTDAAVLTRSADGALVVFHVAFIGGKRRMN